jgi:hypothetical protein
MWGDGKHGEELYDYRSDSREMRNRAGDDRMAGLKEQMRKRLDGILARRGKPA